MMVGKRSRFLVVAIGALLLVGAAECVSSYVLFRHYAQLNKSFYPAGAASVALVHALIGKIEGHRDVVQLRIDHGPLFRADATLGYGMYPGTYRVTERIGPRTHQFLLTVDEAGRRIAAVRPVTADKRIVVAGDSLVFGWGLNDDQTLPWLLQERFSGYQIVNLSLTSYSTVHALLQLKALTPKIGVGDVVVLSYHPLTNEFNVASDEMLTFLQTGFERQLGDPMVVRDMDVRFGYIGQGGELAIGRLPASCVLARSAPSACAQRQLGSRQANRVTISAFHAINDALPGRLVVAWYNGPDGDPVIDALRHDGMQVADLRPRAGDPDFDDETPVDAHAGPFRQAVVAQRLGDWLLHSGVVR